VAHNEHRVLVCVRHIGLRVLITQDAMVSAIQRLVTPDCSFFDVQWTPGMPKFGIPHNFLALGTP